MNWNLVFKLSLFGLAMAFATVFFIPSNVEPIIWLIIFVICAYIIAKQLNAGYFKNGIMVGLINSLWITVVHILLFKTYINGHPQEASMMTKMPLPSNPKLMMLIIGPLIGLVSGLIIGFFSFLASKIIKRN